MKFYKFEVRIDEVALSTLALAEKRKSTLVLECARACTQEVKFLVGLSGVFVLRLLHVVLILKINSTSSKNVGKRYVHRKKGAVFSSWATMLQNSQTCTWEKLVWECQ